MGAIATTLDSMWAAPIAATQVAPSMIDRTTIVVPETTWMTPEAAVQATTAVPETTRVTLMVGMEESSSSAAG